MIAVVFFAVMVDRPALSARNLGLAALVVLVLEPEAVMEAGFQMSFLAVLGLVAFYEGWSRFRAARQAVEAAQHHWSLRLVLWGLAACAASIATSFIAGFSSSLPAAYHFGRIAPYGVLANGLAIPVVGAVVMPMALLSALLMPLGLEQLPLMAMEAGLKVVVLVSDHVASLPGADMIAPRPGPWAVLVLALGLIALCLLRGPVRLLGLAAMALGGVMMLSPPPPPDLLIEATGRNVALRDDTGQLVAAWPRRARFAVEKWLQANGEEVGLAAAAKRAGWRCRPDLCEAEVKGRRVLYVSGMEGQPLDCAGIDILIAGYPLRGACPRVRTRIDRFDLWQSGAAALWVTPQGVRVETARGQQGTRPWVVRPEARARVFTSN
jgi:competence protein ComEC